MWQIVRKLDSNNSHRWMPNVGPNENASRYVEYEIHTDLRYDILLIFFIDVKTQL